jgi:hypothetical protein
MVENEICNVIANANQEFVFNVVEGRAIPKEDVKNFIKDLLNTCDECEYKYIMERLVEEAF